MLSCTFVFAGRELPVTNTLNDHWEVIFAASSPLRIELNKVLLGGVCDGLQRTYDQECIVRSSSFKPGGRHVRS